MITRLHNILIQYELSPEQIRTIISQSAHETAFWSSAVFEHSNNLFGIKAHKRKIKGKLETQFKGYATYTDIEASCRDYISLVKLRYNIEAANNIYLFTVSLKEKGYYTASLKEYTNGMIKAYRQLFPESANKYPALL